MTTPLNSLQVLATALNEQINALSHVLGTPITGKAIVQSLQPHVKTIESALHQLQELSSEEKAGPNDGD